MARLVFTTIGSAGDLFPLLPVGRELRDRGHEVLFAANPWFRSAVEREAFPFHPTGPHLGPEEYAIRPEIFEPTRGGFPALQALMKHFILPHLPTVVRDLRTAAEGADLLLTHPAQLAAPMVAELTGVRWGTLSVFPGNIPSRCTVPQGALLSAMGGAVGRIANGVAWAAARAAMRFSFDRDLNRVRDEFGLARGRDLFLLSGLSAQQVLVLCPPEYCEPPADWAPSVRCTGYTLFDTPRNWRDPPELQAFLDDGPPPVLVSLGTSAAMDAGSFVAVVESALDELGLRGLFLVGQESNLPTGHSSCHAHFAYVPLSRVLGWSAVALHPGGFGTVAQVVTAGVPSVVVPRAFDQAYHGARIEALGLGRTVPWARLRAGRLVAALRDVQEDVGLRPRCREFAESLRGGNGVKVACDRIEERLRERA
ncbi:MAG: glycosyltransferase [Candidatus Binatia bacterium]|nr:glycosyltransferase [Candidatus Binatia bacterium]